MTSVKYSGANRGIGTGGTDGTGGTCQQGPDGARERSRRLDLEIHPRMDYGREPLCGLARREGGAVESNMSYTATHNERPALILDSLSATMLADVMLLELLARGHGTLRLDPCTDEYLLVFDGGDTQALARVPTTIAIAAIHRLGLIADVGLAPPKVGRIRIHLGSHRGAPDAATFEALLSLRAGVEGLGCELHALTGLPREEDGSAVSGIPGVPVSRPQAVKYQVLGELGRGGMGIVYRARHTALDKEVALKVISPAIAHRKHLAAQFVVEGRAACRARHPAIVDVTDFGRLSDGRNYLVMELIEWPSLADEIDAGPIPQKRALGIVLEVARGLAAAHAQGVIHRDLKPANIFVSADGSVKIGDFGLAYSPEHGIENLEGVCFGTAPYMAPELIDGESGDARSDIYALGCITHELLTGAPPFGHSSTQELLDAHRSVPIPPLDVGERPSERLTALHRSLLAKNSSDRPASFDNVIAELEACIEEAP